ncbi:hypothetical protein COT76_01945, partial [Candidatus Berkelbacteria bacterium CG10_big_fil_rev_8_21_14_0_10_33_10]
IGVNKAINGQSGNGTSANDQLQTWLALGKKLTQGGGGGAGGGNYSGDHSINEGRFGGGIISLKTNQNGTIFTKGLISSKGDDGEYKLMGGTTNKIGAGGAGAGGSINLDAGNIYICPTDNNLKPLSMFDARGGDSGRKDYSGHSNYALRSGAGGGGLVSLKATKVIEVGDNNVGVGVKNDLQTQLNSVVAGGGNYSSVTSNKSENGIANLEIDGTTGNNDASCSDGFDETNLPDEPSVSLWVNGEDVDVTSLPSGTEINLTWTQDGANDLKLVTKVGESAETTPQDVTASTSIASFPLEDDIYFKITASNASGSTSDTVKIFQYGSTNLAKGIHIIDTPTNLVSATGESGEWDSSTQPLIFDFDESTNIFKGEVNIEYIVPSDICNKPVNERSIKNEATLIPYLGTYASNNSTDSPSTIETLPEDVQCGVSVGGNVRAHNIDDRKITFKDEIPSLLIVGEDSSLSDPGKGNIQFLKYNGLIDVDMIKKRINRLFKESAKGSPALSGSSTQTGIWRVEAGKTIAGNYSKKNTFIVKNADDSITIDNLNALQSVGIIAKDTNINIEGINKNIAIFAYDTDTLDDICDVDGNCKKNKGNVTFIGGDDINFTGAIVAESISLGDKTGNIDWSSQLQTYVPEGFSEILSPLISEKAP